MLPNIALSPREKTITKAAGIALFLGLIHLGAWRPFARTLDDLEQRITLKEDQLQKYADMIGSSQAARAKLDAALAGSRQTGSDDETRSRLLSGIQGLAAREGVELPELQSQPVENTDPAHIFSFRITASGAYDGIFPFIHALQSPPHSFLVESLEIAKSPARKGALRCRMIISRTLIATDD